ncbi:MAG: hypothetical protein EAZ57_03325 [Cytophagales bacterium]|nr:MAG: hypothetical protein EAZ67_03790 [Cytophagales bacterium]TAF61494.1 MAG: hypothetical protein EAZ57_03325 [Cytophagales bacterium]
MFLKNKLALKRPLPLLLWLLLAVLSGCGDDGNPFNEPGLRTGEIMVDINGGTNRFISTGNLTADATNAYTPAARFINIYRELPSGVYGTMVLRITSIDLDNITLPHRPSKVKVTYSPRPNEPYEAVDSEVDMEITSKEGDLLKGTFSCKVRPKGATSPSFTLTDGSFAIKLIRN